MGYPGAPIRPFGQPDRGLPRKWSSAPRRGTGGSARAHVSAGPAGLRPCRLGHRRRRARARAGLGRRRRSACDGEASCLRVRRVARGCRLASSTFCRREVMSRWCRRSGTRPEAYTSPERSGAHGKARNQSASSMSHLVSLSLCEADPELGPATHSNGATLENDESGRGAGGVSHRASKDRPVLSDWS